MKTYIHTPGFSMTCKELGNHHFSFENKKNAKQTKDQCLSFIREW